LEQHNNTTAAAAAVAAAAITASTIDFPYNYKQKNPP